MLRVQHTILNAQRGSSSEHPSGGWWRYCEHVRVPRMCVSAMTQSHGTNSSQLSSIGRLAEGSSADIVVDMIKPPVLACAMGHGCCKCAMPVGSIAAETVWADRPSCFRTVHLPTMTSRGQRGSAAAPSASVAAAGTSPSLRTMGRRQPSRRCCYCFDCAN